MSYQVLARKWRPQHFRDMAGQEHVLQALINALDSKRLHHAYLFTGTRGVGKTTIARILAKCLNCEVGVSSQPCGQCGACREIAEGRFVDLIEIDAASHTGIDDVREMIDNAQYLPSRGHFKVYLIDEVHMLSKAAFNALLKTLEEPPPHVKFLLATTDPHKLPVTVLSRCLQFNLKNLAPEKIIAYLRTVLEQEMIPFDEGALWLLARGADGSMRDALSLTDQAIAFGGEKLVENAVRTMLGTLDLQLIHPLMDALVAQDPKAMLTAVTQLAEQNPDYAGALDELLRLLHQIAVVQAVPSVLENTPEDRQRMEHLASSLTAEDIQLFYQVGLYAQRDMEFAPDLRSGFEMALLRMIAFKPEGVLDSTATSTKKKTELTPSTSTARVIATPEKTLAIPVTVSAIVAPNVMTSEVMSSEVICSKVMTSEVMAPKAITQATTSQKPDTASITPQQSLTPQNWPAIWQLLPLAGVIRNTASHCSLEHIENTQLYFTLNEHQAGLYDPSHAQRLNDALNAFLSNTYTVHIKIGLPTTATPHQVQHQKRVEQQQLAETAFRQDETVTTLIKHFDGIIVEGSISPLPKTLH